MMQVKWSGGIFYVLQTQLSSQKYFSHIRAIVGGEEGLGDDCKMLCAVEGHLN